MSQSTPPTSGSEEGRPRRMMSVGAGAVVVYENRVLLVRNLFGVTKGKYLLPAGRVLPGEMPDTAAARETFEETNLRVEIEGLLGIRLWRMDSGELNYFFMYRASLLSAYEELQPNLAEIDDARFFSPDELRALPKDETWQGAIAIAFKGLDPQATLWPNNVSLSTDSGVSNQDHWRMWS